MNDRYQTDGPKGQTKKSASSLKPKSKAASSVYVKSTQKTPQEKKAAQKAARQKQAELDRKYYNPPTAQYKKYKRIWGGMLGGAIVCTLVAMGDTRCICHTPAASSAVHTRPEASLTPRSATSGMTFTSWP